jgi:hypothetical protein
MPRKCRSSFTLCGRFNASITCTFFSWGLIPSLVSIQLRFYFVGTKERFGGIVNLAPRSFLITSHGFFLWSFRVPLVMTSKLSMYALSISFIISAWKMSAEPAYPTDNLRYEYLPQEK